jgi:hypothetical protein
MLLLGDRKHVVLAHNFCKFDKIMLYMPANDLKKELVAFIENTNDVELLSLLKEDFVFYGKVKDTDITDELSNEQLKELAALSEEDETKDTHTLEEFKKATQQWRTR